MSDMIKHSSRGIKGRRSRKTNRKSSCVVDLFVLLVLCRISVLLLLLSDVGEAFSSLSTPSLFFPSSSLSLSPINHAPASTADNGRSNRSCGRSSSSSHVLMLYSCPFGTTTTPTCRPLSLPRQSPLLQSSCTVLCASSPFQKHDKEEEKEGEKQQQQQQREGKLKSPQSDNHDNDANNNNNNDVTFDLGTTTNLILGQSSLILASIVASFILRIPNYGFGLQSSIHSQAAIQNGILATVPLFLLAYILDLVEKSIPALKDVTIATQRSVLTLLGGQFRPFLAIGIAIILGIAAGLGEEMLFRGVLQHELSLRFHSDTIAIVVSSLVFGSLHAVTPLYAMLASLASVYFGWLFVVHNENLIVPIVCHGLYDVGALLWAHWSVTVQMNNYERMEIMNWKGGDPSGDGDGGDEKSKRGGRDKRIDIL